MDFIADTDTDDNYSDRSFFEADADKILFFELSFDSWWA